MTKSASLINGKRLLPLFDDLAPTVCTISDRDKADHLVLFERLRSAATAIERTETGLLLQFPRTDDLINDVRVFAVEEKRCCTFWSFAAIVGPDEIVLRWDGPPTVDEYFGIVEAALRSDAPLESFDGLL